MSNRIEMGLAGPASHGGGRAANLAKARALLDAPAPAPATDTNPGAEPMQPAITCPCCGGRMTLVEIFERGATPRIAPTRSAFDIGTS